MRVSVHYRYGGYWLSEATDREPSTYEAYAEVSEEFWERYQRHLREDRAIRAQ